MTSLLSDSGAEMRYFNAVQSHYTAVTTALTAVTLLGRQAAVQYLLRTL